MPKSNGYLLVCALAGAAVFLYLQFFILPKLPVLPSGHQNIFPVDSVRMWDNMNTASIDVARASRP